MTWICDIIPARKFSLTDWIEVTISDLITISRGRAALLWWRGTKGGTKVGDILLTEDTQTWPGTFSVISHLQMLSVFSQ